MSYGLVLRPSLVTAKSQSNMTVSKGSSLRSCLPFATSKRLKLCLVLTTLLLFAYQSRHVYSLTTSRSLSTVAHTDVDIASPEQDAAPASDTSMKATIGMMTMTYGNANPVYERALQSHIEHGQIHNYPLHVLHEKLLGRLWSKPAYIFSVLVDELAKPRDQRLKWLFWFDADTFLLNPNIPLETFLPPSPSFDHINFLCAEDRHGLNDGAFLIRVDGWSLRLMSLALGVEKFRPEVSLKYSEQSAIEHVVTNETEFRDATSIIPQRWMNAYMGPRFENGTLNESAKVHGNNVKEGDLLLHFVGSGDTKRSRMTTFMDSYDLDRSKWALEIENTTYNKEIDKFWKSWAKIESERKPVADPETKETEAREEVI